MAKKVQKSKVKKDGDFIPPDGGWGWMIIIAAGLSNLSALPLFQQFGLLFRERLARLGISSSQTTTIINVHSALNSCVGLANGPVFRTFTYRQVSMAGAILVVSSLMLTTFLLVYLLRLQMVTINKMYWFHPSNLGTCLANGPVFRTFTYRQVSMAGAILVVSSLMLTTFSNNFITFLITFSLLYGAGYGITSASNALALNTYWKERRRLATGLSWTATGLGPMIWPYVITALYNSFGETGTILIISGVSLHTIACALLLQPVELHSKKPNLKTQEFLKGKESKRSESRLSKIKNLSAFSSQYLYNEDDPVNPGYEIIDPGVPMMVHANDGYFSQSRSKVASRDGSNVNSHLASKKPSMTNLTENRSRKSSTLYLNDSKKNSSANLGALAQERETLKTKRKTSITARDDFITESEIEDCPTLKAPQDLKADEKVVVDKIDPKEAQVIADRAEKHLAGSKSSKSLKSFKMDGQYGEKYQKDNHSNISLKNNEENEDRKYLRDNHSNQSYRTRHRRKSNNFNFESEVLKQASLKLEEYLKEREDDTDKTKLIITPPVENNSNTFPEKFEEKEEIELDEDLTFFQKIALFFDLDLLKDFTFINLMLGVTLASFNELNFSLLTPFILGDYGKTKGEIAFFMSLLAGVDISMRFCVPFIAGKIGWENNTFFLVGVMTMATGRVVLAYSQASWVLTLVAIIIGFGKGLRTVFMALVIPTYVPLHKLPGATGLQLITAGVVYLALGPIVGWIKDNASTGVTLHCLNIFTYMTALSWTLEKYIRSRHRKSIEDINV